MVQSGLKDVIVYWISENKILGVFISIILSTVISIIGVFPSVFLTAINLEIFGPWIGTWISFLGEVVGTSVSFWIYRRGCRFILRKKAKPYRWADKLLSAKGKDAFYLIFILRLLPLVPSSLVTLFAAVGSVSFPVFLLANTSGKIPAIILESYSVYQMVNWTSEGKIILTIISFLSLIYILKFKKTN